MADFYKELEMVNRDWRNYQFRAIEEIKEYFRDIECYYKEPNTGREYLYPVTRSIFRLYPRRGSLIYSR